MLTTNTAGDRPVITLNSEQQDAFDGACHFIERGRGQILQIDGLAGTGKTTVLGVLAREYPRIPVVAPTGKAADVLRRKIGRDTSTVHKLMYRLVNKREEKGRTMLDFALKHDQWALRDQIMFLDEHSMVGTRMAQDIERTGIRVVAFGDPGQLQPVNDRRYFDSPDFMLKQIQRQAAESPIIRQAYNVRRGIEYDDDRPAVRVFEELDPETLLWADMVLCWRNVTRQRLTADIRELRELRGLGTMPQRGEPVMCTKNCARFNVFNGGIYELISYDPVSGNITVLVGDEAVVIPRASFEGIREFADEDDTPKEEREVTRFQFGYCATVHKAQGSEWPKVLLVTKGSSGNAPNGSTSALREPLRHS
jgi:exodeoxyribonuclease-5